MAEVGAKLIQPVPQPQQPYRARGDQLRLEDCPRTTTITQQHFFLQVDFESQLQATQLKEAPFITQDQQLFANPSNSM